MKMITIILVALPVFIFGQIDFLPPSDTATVFLPGIASTSNHEHSGPSINTDSKVICWSMWERPKPEKPRQVIRLLNYKNEKAPVEAPFSDKYSDGGPVWVGQNKVLFYSKRPFNSNNPGELVNDLWMCEYVAGEWTEPRFLHFSKFTRYAVSPSITNSGTIYFVGYADCVENNMGIYCAQPNDSGYDEPVLLPRVINSIYFDWTPFVAKDESYLIFSSNRPGSQDEGGDLYISFRNMDNAWTEPINMGDMVNTPAQERFPSVSDELGILFFTRATEANFDDVFWIDIKIIGKLGDQQKN